MSASDSSGYVSLVFNGPRGNGFRFDIGEYNVSYTATDWAGNAVTCQFTINVLDIESPNITCPGDIEVAQDQSSKTANVSWATPVVVDNSGFFTEPISSPESGALFDLGNTTVTVTSRDESGNVGSCQFIVTVIELIKPVCPSSPFAKLDSLSATIVFQIPDQPFSGYTVESNIANGTVVDVPSTTVVTFAITDHPDYNCSFTVEFAEVTCTIPEYPSPELIFIESFNDADPQRQEQCLPGSDVLFGTTCTFDCSDDFNLTDSAMVTCLGSGDISNQLPNCEALDPCRLTPCQNGGTCNASADHTSYSCTCPAFFTHINCNTEIIPNGGQPAIAATCEGDTISPCNWVMEDVDETCGRDLTADELLEILQQEEVTTENVEMVASQAAEITEDTDSLTATGLETVSEILQDISSVDSSEIEVTVLVVDIVNNMADTSDNELQMAQEMSGAVSRAVRSMEEQFVNVEIQQNETLTVTEPNIAAVVDDVEAEEILAGFSVLLTVTGVNETITTDDLRLEQGNATNLTKNQSYLPEASIFVPGEVVANNMNITRVFATGFRDPSLFPFSFKNENNTEENRTVENTEYNRIINSRILGASIGNRVIERLKQPVRILFTPLIQNGTNPICVFWDYEANNGTGNWSTRGCWLSNSSTDKRPECECNHLTNFGILMDLRGGSAISVRVDYTLEIISYFGCCMSIWGLLATILTYAINKKLRDRKPNQILISLCCALLGLYVTFVLLISFDIEEDNDVPATPPCSILAGFLHYFMLASLFWMGVEGYNMHLLLVRVFNTYVPHFLIKASLVAWGCPLLIVAITAGATRQNYAAANYCFLTSSPLIGGVLVPVGVIMIFNMVVFVRVIRQLNKTVQGRVIDETEKRQRLRRFQNAICILLLMGLTWAVGYLSFIRPANAAVIAIFTVLNSLQGFFIFVLYCVRQPQVRGIWRSQFQCCLPRSSDAVNFKFDTSTDHTSSTSKDNSGTLISFSEKQSMVGHRSTFRPESVEMTFPERTPRLIFPNEAFEF
ncbi:adhesion G-protein coupled receptor G6-like [Diadema setosum]|uniref:adhesion G-protein coupled receptor G6-like n=1 Tax=Diadema setosum TaxID=31175 RepID=UPI003B3BE11E